MPHESESAQRTSDPELLHERTDRAVVGTSIDSDHGGRIVNERIRVPEEQPATEDDVAADSPAQHAPAPSRRDETARVDDEDREQVDRPQADPERSATRQPDGDAPGVA